MEVQEKGAQNSESTTDLEAKINAELDEFLGIKTEPKKEDPVAEAKPVVEETKTEQTATAEQTPQAKGEEVKQEKEWWELPAEEKKEEPATEDWKAKFEEATSKLSKIESNKILKTLYDLADSPEFDFEKFIETQVTKRVDYSQLPLENLYKASLEADKIANYTAEEIEEMWEEKKAELTGKSAQEKALKSQLVKQFQESDPGHSEEEPELLKTWKQQKAERDQAQAKANAEFKEVNDGISSFTKGLVGKEIGGVKITEEHAKEINLRMNIDYYRKDGKINANMIAMDRAKAVLFDAVYKHMKTNAVIEAKKQITRPSNQSGGGDVVDTDGRDENQRIVDEAMKALEK